MRALQAKLLLCFDKNSVFNRPIWIMWLVNNYEIPSSIFPKNISFIIASVSSVLFFRLQTKDLTDKFSVVFF